MKDIPVFTTEHGVVGLTLQEIPYNQKAYITVYDARDLPVLLKESVDFCKAVGAEKVYACGHNGLSAYPVYTQVQKMECTVADLRKTTAKTVPVTEQTIADFMEIYHSKMRDVPASAYLTRQKAQLLLEQGSCYFIYRNDVLIGIGIVTEGALSAVASLVPGGGRDAVAALCNALDTDVVRLEVATQNYKAVRLYETLGFSAVGIRNIWYKIL